MISVLEGQHLMMEKLKDLYEIVSNVIQVDQLAASAHQDSLKKKKIIFLLQK